MTSSIVQNGWNAWGDSFVDELLAFPHRNPERQSEDDDVEEDGEYPFGDIPGVSPWRLFQAKAYLAGMKCVDLEEQPPLAKALERVPGEVCRRHQILPLSLIQNSESSEVLVLAIADPNNLSGLDAARAACGIRIQPVLAPLGQLIAAQERHYPSAK